MDCTKAIRNFCSDLQTDIQELCGRKGPLEEKDYQNMLSIALRIGGIAIGLLTAAGFIAGVATVAGAPLSALCLLLATGISLVIAHDMTVMGNNSSPSRQRGLMETCAAAIDKVYEAIDEAIEKDATPLRDFRGTWVVEPMSRLFLR